LQKALSPTFPSEKHTVPREWHIRTKDGAERDVDVRIARALDRVIITLNDVTYRKRAEETLKASHQQLRELAARLQQAREEERTFIAREIHDELGQLLTGLKFDIKWLDKRLPKGAEELKNKTASILELVDESVLAVRRIATEFRPGILDTLGLTAAIEWQAQEFQKRTGIQCHINEQMPDQLTDRHRETALFRIFQESLTNVARHSGATEVKVNLSRQNGSVVLQIRDNGRGITRNEINHSHSIGLLGMRERAHLFGGEVHFSGTPNQGTTVTASIPLEPSGISDQA
jgi:signal transduction histidine kinase